MSLANRTDTTQRLPAQPRSPHQRVWWWGSLIALLVLWAAAISAASHLHRLTGPISVSLCGPWGCTGPTEALLAYHAVWLMVLLPPGFVAGWLLSQDDARRWGWSLVGAGLTGSAILFGWGSIEWLLQASEPHLSLWFRRGLFVMVDQSDVPVVQIMLSGVACLVAAQVRSGLCRTMAQTGSMPGSEASIGSGALQPQSVDSHSRY